MTNLADVLVPPNGEGTRATVLRWCKQVGDTVVKDEPLVELETDKVTVEIPAPASGILIEVLKLENAEVIPDEVLARLSLDGASASRQHAAAPTSTGAPAQAGAIAEARASRPMLSPAVRRLLEEHSVDADAVAGTGRDGRITAQDVTRHVTEKMARSAAAGAGVVPPVSTRIPHTAIRRRVAEHMARS